MRVDLPDPPFADERGTITNLTTTGARSVAVITSKRGSVRARHMHPDEHTCYVVSGRVQYWERSFPGSGAVAQFFGPGEAFHTRAGIDHAMVFIEDTILVVLANGQRDPATHEAGLVRTEWPGIEVPT